MCPWHGWEYSVVTGRGPEGYDEEQVPVFEVEERADGVYVATPPASPRKLRQAQAEPPARGAPEAARARRRACSASRPPRWTRRIRASPPPTRCSSTRSPTRAARLGAETRLVRLRELRFRPCEGNYSKAARACTWPCAITERDPEDQLTAVYEGLVHWADVVLRGDADPLGRRLVALLQDGRAHELHPEPDHDPRPRADPEQGRGLHRSPAARTTSRRCAGSLLTFWSELGFVFPPFPFIAHSRGWDAEDMERNVTLR